MIPSANATAAVPLSVPARRSRDFDVAIATDWAAGRRVWAESLAEGRATPFQRMVVMDAWFKAMAAQPEVEPLIVRISDAATGSLAAAVALVRTTFGLVRTIGFADLGLIDYNAPILGAAAPQDRAGAAILWRALLRALPAADVIELRKMPDMVGEQPNPFAFLDTLPCALSGNVVHTGDDWETYHRTLRKTVRKELERSWRVFTRHPEATFRPVSDPAERRRVLAAIEEQQPLRMQATGKSYALDAPSAAAFYRHLVDVPADDETVTLTALMAGDEIVAALLGLRDAQDYIMVRISNAEGEWANASPGKLIIDRSMAYLHEQGYRAFDFSIGDYDYKRRFGVEPMPLVDLVQPLGWRGVVTSVESRARHFVRRRPTLRRLAHRLLGD